MDDINLYNYLRQLGRRWKSGALIVVVACSLVAMVGLLRSPSFEGRAGYRLNLLTRPSFLRLDEDTSDVWAPYFLMGEIDELLTVAHIQEACSSRLGAVAPLATGLKVLPVPKARNHFEIRLRADTAAGLKECLALLPSAWEQIMPSAAEEIRFQKEAAKSGGRAQRAYATDLQAISLSSAPSVQEIEDAPLSLTLALATGFALSLWASWVMLGLRYRSDRERFHAEDSRQGT